MAVVKNVSPDARSLFRPDGPPLQPGDKATVPDDLFVGRAWPSSTWEVVEPPKGCDDQSTDDAALYVPKPVKSTAKGGDQE